MNLSELLKQKLQSDRAELAKKQEELDELNALNQELSDVREQLDTVNDELTNVEDSLAQNFNIQPDELTNVTNVTNVTDIGTEIRSQQPQGMDIRNFFGGGGSSNRTSSNRTVSAQDFFNGDGSSSQAGSSSQVETPQTESSNPVETPQAGSSSRALVEQPDYKSLGREPDTPWPWTGRSNIRKEIIGNFKNDEIYANGINRLIPFSQIKTYRAANGKYYVQSIGKFDMLDLLEFRKIFSPIHSINLKKTIQWVVENKERASIGSASGDIAACKGYWEKYNCPLLRPRSSTTTTTTTTTTSAPAPSQVRRRRTAKRKRKRKRRKEDTERKKKKKKAAKRKRTKKQIETDFKNNRIWSDKKRKFINLVDITIGPGIHHNGVNSILQGNVLIDFTNDTAQIKDFFSREHATHTKTIIAGLVFPNSKKKGSRGQISRDIAAIVEYWNLWVNSQC